jgi:hypothetical protein
MMDALWLFLAFSIGGSLGFLLFAVLRSSRGVTRKPRAKFETVLHSLEFEGDTVTRF